MLDRLERTSSSTTRATTQTTWAITQTQAGDIAAYAERAYAAELADGYAAPLSDGGLGGDGRIDIYVTDLTPLSDPPPYGVTIPDNNFAVSPDSGYIEFDGTSMNADWGFAPHAVAHELFHLVQFGIWLSSQVSDYWLYEGSADWMGYRVDGYARRPTSSGPDDMTLDCRDPNGTNMCSLQDDYQNNGYSRWPFFEYLSEKYGASFIKDIFTQGQAGGGVGDRSVVGGARREGDHARGHLQRLDDRAADRRLHGHDAPDGEAAAVRRRADRSDGRHAAGADASPWTISRRATSSFSAATTTRRSPATRRR